ncbi:hypothetical protein DERP_010269 [Dermatophagoides pteronyssinus]|uniref:Uncharacterized protein n=1 Tax=Dermatophagoides pteronyssinus TaxID=6956 RepID=A0ABQ8J783_DERPT|nr:hypothetical protein DERP_010269 [Dermatophagoides pteronyssinus]
MEFSISLIMMIEEKTTEKLLEKKQVEKNRFDLSNDHLLYHFFAYFVNNNNQESFLEAKKEFSLKKTLEYQWEKIFAAVFVCYQMMEIQYL